jgi:hypothetical protein
MPHVIIEFKRADCTAWESLGALPASAPELAELKAALDGRKDPYEILDRLAKGTVWDELDILRDDGFMLRIAFPEDH